VISLLRFGCMIHACGSSVILLSMTWNIPRLTVISALPCYFLDNDDVVGSLFDLALNGQ